MTTKTNGTSRRLPRFAAALLPALLALLLAGCHTTDLLYEPKPDDPLDGYEGSLAQAGANTELDFGPKQESLLSGYKTLSEERARLEQRLKEVLAENQNLKARLGNEGEALARERSERAQADARTQQLEQRMRSLEARLLGVGIEKARLEKELLQGRIATLQQELEELAPAPAPAEAAATPPPRSR